MSYPKHWQPVNLFELCQPKQWKTISTKELLPEGYTIYGANGPIGYYSEYTHENPTIMITCRGATCGNIHVSKPYSYINGNAMALDGLASEVCEQKYMRYFLAARGFEDVISGSAQPQITQDGLKKVEVPIAPLPEQKRIAEKLDSVLTHVDACHERLARVQPLLKRFRQSVLTAATSGVLTADWRASQAVAIGPWKNTTIGNLIQSIEAGLNIKCDERPPEADEIGLVKISAVTWGIFNEDESKTLPPNTELPVSTRIRRGDFLISRANTLELVGACVLVHHVSRAVHLSDKVLRLVMPDELKPWLLYVLRSNIGRRQIESLASGNQLSMRNLSQANLKNIEIPLPSPAERDEIVRRVETLFAFADRLDARLGAAQSSAERLTPALLAKAFRGELVPQDPNDEPASELLKRLTVARASTPKPKRGRKDATA